MIIIEGPDGSGKSTLKDKLITSLNLAQATRHCSSKKGPITNLSQWVSEDLTRPTSGRIYDRHALISEPIYGPLVRGSLMDNFENSEWFFEAWRQFLACRPAIVICLPPLGVVKENIKQDPNRQMDKVLENIIGVFWSYHFLSLHLAHELYVNPQQFSLFTYDYTRDSLSVIIEFLYHHRGESK